MWLLLFFIIGISCTGVSFFCFSKAIFLNLIDKKESNDQKPVKKDAIFKLGFVAKGIILFFLGFMSIFISDALSFYPDQLETATLEECKGVSLFSSISGGYFLGAALLYLIFAFLIVFEIIKERERKTFHGYIGYFITLISLSIFFWYSIPIFSYLGSAPNSSPPEWWINFKLEVRRSWEMLFPWGI